MIGLHGYLMMQLFCNTFGTAGTEKVARQIQPLGKLKVKVGFLKML